MIKVEKSECNERKEYSLDTQSEGGYKGSCIYEKDKPASITKKPAAASDTDGHSNDEKKLTIDFTSSSSDDQCNYKANKVRKKFKYIRRKSSSEDSSISDEEKVDHVSMVKLDARYSNRRVEGSEHESSDEEKLAISDDDLKQGKKKSVKRTKSRKKEIEEKPLQCGVCDKVFNRNFDLTRHQQTHNAEKPYKCDTCAKGFSQKVHLKKHKGTHDSPQKNGDKPASYKCKECEKEFSGKFHLTRHEIIHSGERPHKCHLCEKQFTQKSHLKKHFRRIHDIEDSS